MSWLCTDIAGWKLMWQPQSNLYITSLCIAVILYIMVTGQRPKFPVALYFLQSWHVYSGHPVYNGHLTISQGWPLYTGLTVFGLRGLRYTEVSYQKVGLELMATQRCWSELHVGCTTRSKHSTQMYITHYVTAIVVKRIILFCFLQV